ncbi:MAG: 50S ribosomal protein L29 [Calditrichaeota bacterium]|nr:50S ribosomal protein L29 [Calditrichota bacterium]
MKSKEFIKEIKSLKKEELENRINEYLEEIENLRFQAATTQLTNPIKLRTLRRNIARIKTVMSAQ